MPARAHRLHGGGVVRVREPVDRQVPEVEDGGDAEHAQELGARADPLGGGGKRAREAGIRTALVSNSWGVHRYPHDLFEELFDGVVISGVEKTRKPAKRMYELGAERAHESGAELIIVDLRGLEFMDSTGLHRLVAAQQRMLQAGRRFGLVRGGEQVQRLFDLTGLAELLTMADTPDELLEVDQAPGAP